jgi:hypothetical protein
LGQADARLEMSGKDGDPIQTQQVTEAFEKLETEDLRC